MTGVTYSHEFFVGQGTAAALTLGRTLSALLIQLIRPQSVVDVGCGVGGLLSTFVSNGVGDVLGIDGSWVPRELLRIATDSFVVHDLSTPYPVTRTFDLVVSTEVGEHLPATAAETYVNTLVQLGSIVAFGAAIPFQGGTNHVNEQWPAYWAKLFRERGFLAFDCLRPQLIGERGAEELHGQNVILYVRRDRVADVAPAIMDVMHEWPDYPMPVVHPARYLRMHDEMIHGLGRLGLFKVLRALPRLVAQGVVARMRPQRRVRF